MLSRNANVGESAGCANQPQVGLMQGVGSQIANCDLIRKLRGKGGIMEVT